MRGENVFSGRLTEARYMANLSMDGLAKLAGSVVSKQSISRYEKGIMRPKKDALRALAQALHISEDYFDGCNVKIDEPTLQSSSNGLLSDKDFAVVEARLSFWIEQYMIKEQESGCRISFWNPLKGIKAHTIDDAVQAACLLREQWECCEGPISSVLHLLEKKGVKILLTELPEYVNGLSTWVNSTIPVVVIDSHPERMTVEHLRYTVVKMLAYLLLALHGESPLYADELCGKFANFFLLPKYSFLEEVEHQEKLTIEQMVDLKELYGLPIKALADEAFDLQMISHQHYDWWREKLEENKNEVGWGIYAFPEITRRERILDSIIQSRSEL